MTLSTTSAAARESIEGSPAVHAEPLDQLAERAPRLANVVEATSRRRDVREFRARVLLLLLHLRCPTRGRPARPWYVPGAVARLGAGGLRRAWRGFWGQDPPSLRTFRAHLGAMEAACLLVRSPGDWIPIRRDPSHPERRPRYADTLHVLDDDQAAEWWAAEGFQILEARPEVRHHPDRWRLVFASWRDRAASRDLSLVGTLFEGLKAPPIECRSVAPDSRSNVSGKPARAGRTSQSLAAGLRALVREARDPLELLSGARAFGVLIRGKAQASLASDEVRLRGALALLAVAYARGDRIRNRAAWVVRNFKHVRAAELAQALRACRGGL